MVRRGPKLALLTLFALLGLAGSAQAQSPVPLGAADPFAVLAGTTVSNSGATVVGGDLGVSPGTSVTGFPPGMVNGTIHAGDATAAQAQADLATAYDNAAGQAVTAIIPAELGGTTLPPGVYESDTGAFVIDGMLTLDGQGDGNAVFIFKAATTLGTGAGSQIALIKSAQSCNVFWQVGGSASLGPGSGFRGNVLALNDITSGSGASVDGRLLSRSGPVALDTDSITAARCDAAKPVVKISGIPKRCTSHNFKVRIAISDALGVTTTVSVDGVAVKRRTKRSFTVAIDAKGVIAGPHTIKAVARDAAGNVRVKTARFVRCPRSSLNFTG
jgi:ice-binding like protein